MNLPWLVARASGLVSWSLLALSVTWGFLLSTRVLGRRPKARWLLDLHRFLGGLAVIFVGVHVTAILVDSYVPFSPVQLLVPFTSEYRPAAVAFGIVAFYLLLAVEISSLLMRRLPKNAWRAIHLASYPLYILATVHLLTAGTDAGNIVVRTVAIVTLVEATVFVTIRASTARGRLAGDPVEPAPDIAAPTAWASTPMPSAPPLRPTGSPPRASR
ncbi:MAG: ferric reductase-like transmembrane domain-containing protein [Actinobacteria bacterium]|nr:ferric reductase-like transmembrane domain-containing protein [Actinomycetota bacterium]